MAQRPIFLPYDHPSFYRERQIEFKFHTGFAPIQKLRSIASLHEAAKKEGIQDILEISSKSSNQLGWQLSAFNLQREYEGQRISVESLYHGSKKFETGKMFEDLYYKSPLEAKRDPRLRTNGKIVAFEFDGQKWKNEPKGAFYEWLYISTLALFHHDLLDSLLKYEAFSDIEFNPKRSINCQARAVAMAISLYRNNLLFDAIASKESFLSIVYATKEQQRTFQFWL